MANRLLDPSNGHELMVLKGETDGVRDLAFVSNSERLASIASSGDILGWDITPGGPPSVATEVGLDAPCDILLSSDGRKVAMTTTNGTFTVVSLTSGQPLITLPDQHISWFSLAAVSPDWRQIAMVDSAGDGWLRELDTGRPLSPPGLYDSNGVQPRRFGFVARRHNAVSRIPRSKQGDRPGNRKRTSRPGRA